MTFDGLKQLGALSNLLFNIALEVALQELARKCAVHRQTDICTYHVDRRAMKETFVSFEQETARVVFTIDTSKKKFMIVD